jgi:mannose-6-phosphate isomerase-like protein (cupin superfamily)
MTMRLDKAFLQPMGPIQYRRVLTPEVFTTNWSYVDHMVVPKGASAPKERHEGVEEFYYVMSGEGVAHIGNESAPIYSGDAIPVQFNEVHSFENMGASELELMVVGIARVKNALDTQIVK